MVDDKFKCNGNCEKKKSYPTKTQANKARKAIYRRYRKRMRIYQCAECEKWFLTKKFKSQGMIS